MASGRTRTHRYTHTHIHSRIKSDFKKPGVRRGQRVPGLKFVIRGSLHVSPDKTNIDVLPSKNQALCKYYAHVTLCK